MSQRCQRPPELHMSMSQRCQCPPELHILGSAQSSRNPITGPNTYGSAWQEGQRMWLWSSSRTRMGDSRVRTHRHRHQGTRTLQSGHSTSCDIPAPPPPPHPPPQHSTSPPCQSLATSVGKIYLPDFWSPFLPSWGLPSDPEFWIPIFSFKNLTKIHFIKLSISSAFHPENGWQFLTYFCFKNVSLHSAARCHTTDAAHRHRLEWQMPDTKEFIARGSI